MEHKKRGLHNWRNLIKFDRSDLVWILFILMILATAWAYREDTRECREMLDNEELWNCWRVNCATNWTGLSEDYLPFLPQLPKPNPNVSIYP